MYNLVISNDYNTSSTTNSNNNISNINNNLNTGMYLEDSPHSSSTGNSNNNNIKPRITPQQYPTYPIIKEDDKCSESSGDSGDSNNTIAMWEQHERSEVGKKYSQESYQQNGNHPGNSPVTPRSHQNHAYPQGKQSYGQNKFRAPMIQSQYTNQGRVFQMPNTSRYNSNNNNNVENERRGVNAVVKHDSKGSNFYLTQNDYFDDSTIRRKSDERWTQPNETTYSNVPYNRPPSTSAPIQPRFTVYQPEKNLKNTTSTGTLV